VLLDHVIADRYGCNRPALLCLPDDVARGRYVLGIGRNHPQLKRAIDSALSVIKGNGELEHILREWKLWDARQETAAPLASTAPLPSAALPVAPSASTAPVASPSPAPSARRMTLGQVQLFLQGAAMTLLLSCASFALASPLGVGASILRLYSGRVGRALATAYVELFRGTPLLLQLYVLYFGISGVVKLSPLTAAILALALNYGAYEAEVHRGALLSIPRAQTEAARALGLGRWQTLGYVLLPQSIRHALPAVTNDFVALLKDSSLVSVITVVELTKRMTIVAVEVRDWVTPGLLCAGLYFLLSFPLAQLARRLERSLSHDQHPLPA
jgi:polar amino acid transport system substrate-binding protein